MGNVENETRFLLKKYNISANKSLGQNFLIADDVIDGIVEVADVNSQDLVIEIGPGLGTLTSKLLEKAGKVVAIELDERMLIILNDRFSLYNNFEVIHQDILKTDLDKLIDEQKQKYNLKSVKVVANLPYYITTPIIMKLLEDRLNIESITVMVQKEVAQRLTATLPSKLAGAITYSINYYCEAKEEIEVPKECFIPAPDVNSSVIKLSLREKPLVEIDDEKMLFKLIKSSFMQRRKTLINGISNANIATKEEAKKILNSLEIEENVRGENLTLEQFAKISNLLSNM